eukprot:jgi/Ulvmu1/8328/UM042_0034.1
MAFRWGGRVYVDTRLDFGQRKAPEVAYRFSMVVLWHVREAVRSMGLAGCVHILVVCNDWLVLAEREAECRRVWAFIIGALRDLGFTVNALPHKCIPPCQELPWLGLLLNSRELIVALPEEKLVKALAAVQAAGAAATVTRRQLDSLFGYLSFCALVVYGGRAFLHGVRRLRYRPDGQARAGHHRVHVNAALREDMAWWSAHLRLLNGTGGCLCWRLVYITSRWRPTWTPVEDQEE